MADPGFPQGGGTNSPGGGGANIRICQFSQKLHEIERIWTRGGGASLAPRLDPPLITVFNLFSWFKQYKKYQHWQFYIVRETLLEKRL